MLWSPNTQLHYPFENQANDYSGHARHGTVNGSGVYATKPGGGRCLYFDGVGDYVATPSFGLSGTVVVFAADVRCAFNAGIRQSFVGGVVTGELLYSERNLNTDDLRWFYNDISTLVTATGFFTGYDDVWFHLLVVCDYAGKNTYFYRKGILFSTQAMAGTPAFPSSAFVKYIGCRVPGSRLLTDGYLANVQLWTLATMPPAGQMLTNVNRIMLGMNPIWSV